MDTNTLVWHMFTNQTKGYIFLSCKTYYSTFKPSATSTACDFTFISKIFGILSRVSLK